MPSRLKNVCAELNTLSQRFSKIIAAHERPLAALGGGGRRTHRADQRGAAVNAAMGDVFKIVGCSAATEPGGFDGSKYHPVTALCAGEHQARQAGRQNVLAVHGINSVWRGPKAGASVAQAGYAGDPPEAARMPCDLVWLSLVPFMIGGRLACGWQLGMYPLASAVIFSRSNARSSPWDWASR
jgi:hypothetical protein